MSKHLKFSANQPIDCACVIHGTGYDWIYVERLYNMLKRTLPQGINFHVYTEHNRSVPPHMIKHCLMEWSAELTGPKKSWWYKMQMFNPEHHQGQMLYFDLDVVIARDLQWIFNLDSNYFYGIRDFRHLQGKHQVTINSSCMWWNVKKYSYVWDEFVKRGPLTVSKQFYGDQDFITATVNYNDRRFFEDKHFESYRWQCLDGGFDFQRRIHRAPGTGVHISGDTAVVVFHGKPKPHEIKHAEIAGLWQ
jgi:hypothetical protein